MLLVHHKELPELTDNEVTLRMDPDGITHTGRLVHPQNGRDALGNYSNDVIWVPECKRGVFIATWLWRTRYAEDTPTCLACVVCTALT